MAAIVGCLTGLPAARKVEPVQQACFSECMQQAAFTNKLRQLLLNVALLQLTALSTGIGSLAVQLPG